MKNLFAFFLSVILVSCGESEAEKKMKEDFRKAFDSAMRVDARKEKLRDSLANLRVTAASSETKAEEEQTVKTNKIFVLIDHSLMDSEFKETETGCKATEKAGQGSDRIELNVSGCESPATLKYKIQNSSSSPDPSKIKDWYLTLASDLAKLKVNSKQAYFDITAAMKNVVVAMSSDTSPDASHIQKIKISEGYIQMIRLSSDGKSATLEFEVQLN